MERENPPPDALWNQLMEVSAELHEEEHPSGHLGTAEGRALWRQREKAQNRLAHLGSEFLKAHNLTWNGYRKRKIPGLDY